MSQVTVNYESNSLPNLPLVGKTIQEARAAVASLLNLPGNANPSVTHCDNTREPAGNLASYRLREGDSLEFAVQMGSKGCCKKGKGSGGKQS